MFRSSITTAISGTFAGFFAVMRDGTPLEGALAALITAVAVAIADHVARTRSNRRHEEKFLREHRLTRAAARAGKRRKRVVKQTQTKEKNSYG